MEQGFTYFQKHVTVSEYRVQYKYKYKYKYSVLCTGYVICCTGGLMKNAYKSDIVVQLISLQNT